MNFREINHSFGYFGFQEMCILLMSHTKTFSLIARSNKIVWMIRQSNRWVMKCHKQMLF